MKRPEQAVTDAAVALGRALREAGLATTVDAELTFCGALAELDVRRRGDVYWAARAVFVKAPQQIPVFDAVFERFWRGMVLTIGDVGAEHGESDPRMPGPQHGGESLPQYRTEGRSSRMLDGDPTRATREMPAGGGSDDERGGGARRRGVLAAYSPDEVAAPDESLGYAQDELMAMRRLAEDLRRAVPHRRTRRVAPARRAGRLDVRRTVRRSLRTEGEALAPAWVAPGRAPRRLLVLCDVSGSMERYTRALLATLEGVVGSGLHAEAFVFATRLTRLTRPLGGRDVEQALEQARAAVPDWSGGTRIGHALAEFNRRWAPRGLARGAIAIVVSDGWDRGDPVVLAREVDRLRLQARRLVWINPRPVDLAGQPLALGMRAALPYVDDYVAGMDATTLPQLSRLIAHLGSGRPARSQRVRPAVR